MDIRGLYNRLPSIELKDFIGYLINCLGRGINQPDPTNGVGRKCEGAIISGENGLCKLVDSNNPGDDYIGCDGVVVINHVPHAVWITGSPNRRANGRRILVCETTRRVMDKALELGVPGILYYYFGDGSLFKINIKDLPGGIPKYMSGQKRDCGDISRYAIYRINVTACTAIAMICKDIVEKSKRVKRPKGRYADTIAAAT